MAGDTAWSPPADTATIIDELFTWFKEHQRPFPWRSVDDPWQLLVLEVMSQQTQLDRVTEPWLQFVEQWPTPASLADAERAAVLSFWSDHRLGYNRRARFLHEAAERLVREYDGVLPREPAELESLPGVGPYTANAVASFAFNTGGPVIDTNVKRVLFRAFDIEDDRSAYEEVSDVLTADVDIGTWNGAIMELGGVACETTPRCDVAACPLRRWCVAYQRGDFTAPDVPTQPPFEGSRRQYRGRVLKALSNEEPQPIATLGPRIKVSFDPTAETDLAWLQDLLDDMATDGLVEVDGGQVALPR